MHFQRPSHPHSQRLTPAIPSANTSVFSGHDPPATCPSHMQSPSGRDPLTCALAHLVATSCVCFPPPSVRPKGAAAATSCPNYLHIQWPFFPHVQRPQIHQRLATSCCLPSAFLLPSWLSGAALTAASCYHCSGQLLCATLASGSHIGTRRTNPLCLVL